MLMIKKKMRLLSSFFISVHAWSYSARNSHQDFFLFWMGISSPWGFPHPTGFIIIDQSRNSPDNACSLFAISDGWLRCGFDILCSCALVWKRKCNRTLVGVGLYITSDLATFESGV